MGISTARRLFCFRGSRWVKSALINVTCGQNESAAKEKRQGRHPAAFDVESVPYFDRFTVFLSSAPGVNFATFRAAILMVAPV